MKDAQGEAAWNAAEVRRTEAKRSPKQPDPSRGREAERRRRADARHPRGAPPEDANSHLPSSLPHDEPHGTPGGGHQATGRRHHGARGAPRDAGGHRISPGRPTTKRDGPVVRTLRGGPAYQLGGKKAFARVAEDDKNATSPGDVLRELIEYGPVLILIDEWVAYAAGPDSLPVFARSPIFPSSWANAGSERRLVHIGRTLTDRTALPARSWQALASHSMASAFSRSPQCTRAKATGGTYFFLDSSRSSVCRLRASSIRFARAYENARWALTSASPRESGSAFSRTLIASSNRDLW